MVTGIIANKWSFAMKEGQGTLKELTALWRQLDPRGRWLLSPRQRIIS